MATSFDLFLSGDHEAAKAELGRAFETIGLRVLSRPDGNWVVERGNKTTSFWLGAMAGKNFYVSFETEFFSGPEGELIARFNRNLTSGALRGGAIGANMANNAFNQTYSDLVAQLQGSGVLARSVANG